MVFFYLYRINIKHELESIHEKSLKNIEKISELKEIQQKREKIHERLAEIYLEYKDVKDACKGNDPFGCHPTKELLQKLITPFLELVELEPSEPLNLEGLETLPTLDCSQNKYKTLLTGKKKEKASRVFFLNSFSYEFDLLEIKMYEYEGILDHMVIVESGWTHREARRQLKTLDIFSKRLAKFFDKLVYFNQDDSDALPRMKKDWGGQLNWGLENNLRDVLLNKMKTLKTHFNYKEDDLFVMGDFDEWPGFFFFFFLFF